MVGYRRRIDILADMLEVISLDAKKTEIMFKANLSYKALTKYLSQTIEASLVTYEIDRHCYTLTCKGRDFLNAYEVYREANKQIEKLGTTKKLLNSLCPCSKASRPLVDMT